MFRSFIVDLSTEIEEALKDADCPERCLAYIREVTDMAKLLCDRRKYDFLDFQPLTKDRDGEATRELEDLTEQIQKVLPKESILVSRVQWGETGITRATHMEYLQKLCKHLFNSLKGMIQSSMERQSMLDDDDLYVETLQHWNIASEASKLFVDRKDVLRIVKEYLLTETDQPLVLVGGTGSGKTAFISKISIDINEAVHNGNLGMRTAIMFRFIGQSPQTNTAHQLLYSLCHQLAYVMGKYRHEVPKDFKTLKLYFIDLLQRGEFGGMIIIALDSLHLLSTCENGHKLEWLPSRIAQNVKVIVTSNTGDKEICERLHNKCQESYFEIPPLAQADSENMMKAIMNNKKRTVSYQGWRHIQNLLNTCTLPVYIKTMLEELSLLKSYDHIELGETTESAIDTILDVLEEDHGGYLVSRVIAFLTAAKHGLSITELMDVLSLDEDLLSAIYCDWHPTLRRIQPHRVMAILQDLEHHTVERRVGGVQSIFWKHNQFRQRAEDRYLSWGDDKIRTHSILADYYSGKYGGSFKKEFIYPPRYCSKIKLATTVGEACRFLPTQPNFFGTTEDDEKYNMRKMTQLPHNLLESGRTHELRENVMCNFSYIYFRIKGSSLQELLTDIDAFNDRQSSLVGDALRMCGSALDVDIKSLPVELTGRLLPHIKRYESIKNLVHQCDLAAQRCCPLVPNVQIYSAPGGPLQYECQVGGSVFCPVDIDVFTSEDGILLTAKPYYSSRVRVWELSHGDARPDMMMPVGEIHPTRNGKYLNVFQNDKSVKIFKSDCGELHGEVEYGYGVMSALDVSNKYLVFAIEKRTGPYVIDIERKFLLHKFSFHTHAVAINPDDTHLTFNTGRTLVLYQLPLMERRCVAEASDVPQDIVFISATLTCFVLTKSKMVESIFFDTISRKFKLNSILYDLDIKEMIMSHTEKYVLFRAGRSLHQVDVNTEKVLRKYQQLPQGVFVDPQSSFTGAGFTPDDEFIVASRYTFVAVWDCKTGDPLRVLHSSISPITKMFTSDAVNKAVSLLENNTFQVWNLDNIDTDILHANEVLSAPVKHVNLSSANRIACFDNTIPEVKIINTDDGRVKDILQHSNQPDIKLTTTLFSPNGRYIVTRCKLISTEDSSTSNKNWSLLRDDIMWDLDKNLKVYQTVNSRFITFDKKDVLAMNVSCMKHNIFDWTENIYCIIALVPSTGETTNLIFPQSTEFVSDPHLVYPEKDSKCHMSAIVQTCIKTYDAETGKEINRRCEIKLMLQELSDAQSEPKFMRLQNILDTSPDDFHFLDCLPLDDKNVLLPYCKGVDFYTFEAENGIIRPKQTPKGALIFNLESGTCLNHFEDFINPTSDINSIIFSKTYSAVLDSENTAFFGEAYTKETPIEVEFAPGTGRLALGGRYIVALSLNMREVVVIRTSDSSFVGHLFVHGRATCLSLGADDRTVAVGCEDGRVMILTLILELADPVTNLIGNLSSRVDAHVTQHTSTSTELIKEDIRHMSCMKPDLVRLSSRIQSAKIERRPPSRQSISNAVMVTQNNNQSGAETCHVQ